MTDQEPLRVLIADDDAGMRTVMRKIIAKVEGFTLVAEAGDGKTTLELTEQLKPDVVFLDVEMPNLSGVDCARAIQDMDPAIVIIFATAHDTYMGDAFEVYAFDYLVKPFKVDRVIQTLERARDRLLRRDVRPVGAPVPRCSARGGGQADAAPPRGREFHRPSGHSSGAARGPRHRALHGGRRPLRHWRLPGRDGGAPAQRRVLPLPQVLYHQPQPHQGHHALRALDLCGAPGKHQARRAHHPREYEELERMFR